MTHIAHHLSDSILVGYAAGILPEAFDLVVATHISLCDECRARLAAHEAVGGSVLESAGQTDMSDDALAACFARIEAGPKDPIVAPLKRPAPVPGGIFPSPLRDYVGGDLEAVKWRPAGLGVKQAILKTTDGATVRLLKIRAGAEVPDHGHHGTELTLVLQGAFRDEFARFGPGDVEICNAEIEHTPIAEEGPDCICLAATDARLRFSGLGPRIAQRFLRI